ncbi:ribonuclease H [Pseudomonas sp. SZ57]|uniref:retron Ec67 family RNA-directed DNA polymerase/endonuclease n=1 Tax=Pseudomonas sp. SZ57 TaxID=2662259 RepID=UPI00129246CC|nr:retron Ec67 family RNA-directed DNA polymerase/endonuclease [Pseudomonas sp. SZ57]MQQ37654.1 ribonuclease H [Pseudomonas sp. SZ57]
MKNIDALRAARTKPELALLLGVKASFLTYVLYVLKPDTLYRSFTLKKKSGGTRTIHAPYESLKSIQSSLSNLLQDCIEEINKAKPAKAIKTKFIITKKDKNSDHKKKKRPDHTFTPTLSHGFVRKRSIITNAMMHLNRKNVLNVDLKDFFDSFNFGRVRGFFITNRNFQLHPDIATVIAQIACYNNTLPQGSPCSPVITNLITHILDIKLAALARTYSCTYSRYVDDITFSTRKKIFPEQIMKDLEGSYTAGYLLNGEIQRAGFNLNPKKTRIRNQDSRQEVTGLVVNKKPNVNSKYWRTVKSQCHLLFKSGTFVDIIDDKPAPGNINQLEGRLNFIDQVDYYNRLRDKAPLNPEYMPHKPSNNTRRLLSGRELTFSRFLYFRSFYANEKVTIICEGKTDNIYLKAAIKKLSPAYPKLAKPKSATSAYQLLVSIFNYSARTRFLMELYGGTPYLKDFIAEFKENHKFYKAPKPANPVIIILDNDKGFNIVESLLRGDKVQATPYPRTPGQFEFRGANFIHVTENLYLVLTPLAPPPDRQTAIEDLFTQDTRDEQVDGKILSLEKEFDKATHYGKDAFANKVVLVKKSSIDFSGFNVILNRIMQCIEHYDSIK